VLTANKKWGRRALQLLVMILVACSTFAFASDEAGSRKLRSKVAPAYPEMARRISLSGAVKLEVVVAANGSVKAVRPLGGHPMLIDAAVSAVKQWRYEPGTESVVAVEVKFVLNQ
jgi:protein TonB